MYVIKRNDGTYYKEHSWKKGNIWTEDINKAQVFKSKSACKNSRASTATISKERIEFKEKWEKATAEERKSIKFPKTFSTRSIPADSEIIEIIVDERIK